MSGLNTRMQLPKMRVAYIAAFENLLTVKPDAELTQKAALNEDFMRRLFAHIEANGVVNCDLEALHFRITAAQLGIVNSQLGWEKFLNAKPQGGALL